MNQLSFCTLFVSVNDKLVSILPYHLKPQDLCGFDGPSALLLDRLPIYQKTMKQSRIEELFS